MTDHDPRAASDAALHDLMTGDGSSETYRATAAIVHALHGIADAIGCAAPKPVETDDAQPTRCGRVRINQLNGPYHPCQLDKGHDGEHQYLVQMLQDAAGSPQSDEQPEPGQVDGARATGAPTGPMSEATGPRSAGASARGASPNWATFHSETITAACQMATTDRTACRTMRHGEQRWPAPRRPKRNGTTSRKLSGYVTHERMTGRFPTAWSRPSGTRP